MNAWKPVELAVLFARGEETPRHYLQAELYDLVQNNDQIFEFLQRGSLDGIWYWDLENPQHEWMSDAFWETLGYDPTERRHLASEWQNLIFPEDRDLAVANLEKHLADPAYPYDQVVRYRSQDGSTVWVRCRGVAIRDQEGRPVRMLGAHNDLTPLKRLEEELRVANAKLEALARTDPLTGIRNRRSFDEEFPAHAAIGSRSDSALALIVIDIDHFKALNDTFGHPAGDLVLQDLACDLTGVLREGDLCFRLGGEEFAVVAHGADERDVRDIAERIRRGIGRKERGVGRMTVSIGVCTLPEHRRDDSRRITGEALARAMYRLADEALYAAKAGGRDRCEFVSLDFQAL